MFFFSLSVHPVGHGFGRHLGALYALDCLFLSAATPSHSGLGLFLFCTGCGYVIKTRTLSLV